MSQDEVSAKMAEIERKFDEFKTQKDELDRELYRLQGEYRFLEGMKKPDPAKTIEAKPAGVK